MSPINYKLELPTQWSIHPVFHINLLTPYRETITHGANYQRPPPDLVNNTEENKVKKILILVCSAEDGDFSIWSNGRDTLTRTTCGLIRMMYSQMIRCGLSKNQTPDARMHLRAIQSMDMPHSPLASSRASSTSYYAPHILSMSSDGHSDLPSNPQHSAQ